MRDPKDALVESKRRDHEDFDEYVGCPHASQRWIGRVHVSATERNHQPPICTIAILVVSGIALAWGLHYLVICKFPFE